MGLVFGRLWLVLLGLLLAASAAHADDIVLACDDVGEWPPYTYYRRVQGQRTQELTGFTVELVRGIAARRGWTVQFELLPWKRCLEDVRAGTQAIALSAIATPERQRDYLMSLPIYETQLMYLWSKQRHPAGFKVVQRADLHSLRVGGIQGYSYGQLDARESASLTRARSYDSLVQMLHLDRLDIVLVSEAVLLGHAALGNAPWLDDAALGRAPVGGRPPSPFHLLFSRQDPRGAQLHQAFDEEIARMTRNGELAKLRQSYVAPLGLP